MIGDFDNKRFWKSRDKQIGVRKCKRPYPFNNAGNDTFRQEVRKEWWDQSGTLPRTRLQETVHRPAKGTSSQRTIPAKSRQKSVCHPLRWQSCPYQVEIWGKEAEGKNGRILPYSQKVGSHCANEWLQKGMAQPKEKGITGKAGAEMESPVSACPTGRNIAGMVFMFHCSCR